MSLEYTATIPASLKPFFQEYDFAALDPKTDADIIIERTLHYGNRQELRWLFHFYSRETIAGWFHDMGAWRLPKKHLPFWSLVLHIEPRPRPQGGVWPY